MDDDKSVVEKTMETVKQVAGQLAVTPLSLSGRITPSYDDLFQTPPVIVKKRSRKKAKPAAKKTAKKHAAKKWKSPAKAAKKKPGKKAVKKKRARKSRR